MAPSAGPLVAEGPRVRRIASEGRVVADAGLEEAAGYDPLDQTATETVAAGGVPVVLEEGRRRLGPVGTG